MSKRRPRGHGLAIFAGLLIGLAAPPLWAQRAAAPPSDASSFLGAPSVPAPASAPVSSVEAEAPPSSPALQGGLIEDIKVEGTERIEPDTVTSYLQVAKGQQATPEKLNASLKALYATGLFADIDMRVEGATLVVKVTENPIVNRVIYQGNDAISKKDLEKEVQLKPRLVYTLPRVQRDVQRILDLYRRQGRFAAEVQPKLVKLPQNRVNVIFDITEGDRTGIASIKFVGNSHFDSDELQSVISTRETAWWRFFSNTDYYDPDRLAYDRELLRRFYLNHGYIDFRVRSAVAELTPDRADFFITFTLDEGPRYKFGKIAIKSEIKGLNGETLRQYLTTHKGDWYDADMVQKSIVALTTVLGDRQYAFATITPQLDRDKKHHIVKLTYDIKQGARVYIGRIEIRGNTRTIDKVIRREMLLAEGDPFSSTLVERSEQRLKDLNFFKTVTVKPANGAEPDRANLDVNVKEKSTGEVAVGAGFSSTDGPLGDFTIHESNFMGRGEDARFTATISGITRELATSFTDPYFMDRDLSAGVDLFHVETDYQSFSSYNEASSGFNLRLGYPLSQHLRQQINYTFHYDSITNVPSDASLFILDQQGSSTTSAFGQELDYDTRDSKLDPTKGYLLHFNSDVAGAGGSRKYVRLKVGGTQYYPLTDSDKWIVSGTAEAGQIWSLAGDTMINERFFLGDDTLRGFQYAGVGPRDLSDPNQDALGGNRFARATIDLATPTPFPPELGLKGHIFSDAGILGSAPVSAAPAGDVIANDESPRVSVGLGLTWDSPFGPLRLDFAEPVVYKSYDKIQHIHFSFGAKF
ncbi:MAG TPA: outer membrane protein assembly factor BamA [Alphaproteobacteria bacterium]|nr:outer membrane protein assembly factor BamA [Alphaproteobacteria bacterium]